jgi:hypothetical protein
LCPVRVYKYNPVHYQIILFVSEFFLLYSPLFVFLFSSFILYFQLRLSPVPQTLPVPIPCYYHGSSTDNVHANNSFRPLSLPAPSRTEADPPAETEIIAGSLQVSNWCYTDEYWQSVLGQICFISTSRKYNCMFCRRITFHEFVALSTHKFDSLLHNKDRLCGLVVRVFGYRSGGPGSIPGTTKKKISSRSGTGSTQPREYN